MFYIHVQVHSYRLLFLDGFFAVSRKVTLSNSSTWFAKALGLEANLPGYEGDGQEIMKLKYNGGIALSQLAADVD